MKKAFVFTAFVGSLLFSGSALAEETSAAAAAPADEKKIGVGGDLQFVLPVGDLADAYGPLIGAVVRGGFRVAPALEVTGRVGYLGGLAKEQGGLKSSLTVIPIWLGARYFLMEPSAGLYGAAELGVNMLKGHAEGDIVLPGVGTSHVDSSSDTETRIGFNIGAGYVVSKELPIDIRAQFTHLNLLGTDDGEKGMFGIGVSVGYTASF